MNMIDALFGDGMHHVLFGFGTDCRAMTAAEILQMQLNQQAAMQNAVWPLSYLQGLAQYHPPELRPLDERFADFKIRLAEALAHQRARASPTDPQ